MRGGGPYGSLQMWFGIFQIGRIRGTGAGTKQQKTEWMTSKGNLRRARVTEDNSCLDTTVCGYCPSEIVTEISVRLVCLVRNNSRGSLSLRLYKLKMIHRKKPEYHGMNTRNLVNQLSSV